MSSQTDSGASATSLDEMVAQSDTGARNPGGAAGKIILGVALFWSLFQLWIASPVPFMLGFGVFNDTEARSIHLALALFLAFTAYPAFTNSPRDHIPLTDWIFAILGAFSAAYLYIFYASIADRVGAPITIDYVVAVVGMLLLLEATRRSLGPPLMIIAIIFLVYTFFGPYMPGIIAHKGNTLGEVVNHQWITTEGVFGIALGVSTSFVFLFVLFGSLLDKGGAGNYFIQVAFSLMGHMRGGPAKAAVVSSAMTGLISGSSIANVVTTGTFTIPLMKRAGYSARLAGAIEAAASSAGQILPPVMGAAAFLMAEILGVPYGEIALAALVPGLLYVLA
ncbi:MAG: TRAP transporter permease, partial [Geminicoccaceae bacterium]|nr:TRAP transporter permease [Geminicoccaceae bacterium]